MWLNTPKLPFYKLDSFFLSDEDTKENPTDISFSEEQCFFLAHNRTGNGIGTSATAVITETVRQVIRINKKKTSSVKDKRYFLKSLFFAVHRAIKKNSQTTASALSLSVLYVSERNVYIGSYGDIQVFLFQQTDGKWITRQTAQTKDLVTQSLGINDALPEVFIDRVEITPGIIFFMGTEGVYEWITTQELAQGCFEVAEKKKNADTVLKEFFSVAKQRGSSSTMSAWFLVSSS